MDKKLSKQVLRLLKEIKELNDELNDAIIHKELIQQKIDRKEAELKKIKNEEEDL